MSILTIAGKVRRFGARRLYKMKDFKKVYVTISDEPAPTGPEPGYKPTLSEAGEAVMAEIETSRRAAAEYEAKHGDGRL